MEKIELNKENQITYNNLLSILNDHNRVAVIQPTGTGKSMISLKYLQDNPDKNALYITSYNINIKITNDKIKKYGGFGEVDVVNYRNLILDMIPPKKYNIVIIDEYQHCGADVTSYMLEKLLSKFPDATIIGTTATPIRYLDNERDMTKEIFNNVVARNMSLAYAIANKILPEFTYVAGLYDYDDKPLLQEYSDNIENLSDEAKKNYLSLLAKLSKCLEKASGINKIFSEHLKPDGKYVVFCDSKNQIEEIIEKINKKELNWFDGIDEEPEVYSCHYGNDNQENEKEFEAFKNTKSEHLKLLFNINMASEGMHLDDIDGVIMFRRTESLNVYIQQLGRALAVDTKSRPIIFDFANNISNQFIYNVLSGISNEVNKGLTEGKKNITSISKIKVFDDIKEVNDILTRLKSIVLSDWDKMFVQVYMFKDILINYINDSTNYRKNSRGRDVLDLNYKKLDCEDKDYSEIAYLLRWLENQLKNFNKNKLTIDKIKKLQFLGVINDGNQFSEEDKKIFETFCSKILPSIENIDAGLSEYPIENQLFLVKDYINKYYFRKSNQSYTMDDYIQICSVGLLKAKNNYSGFGSYKFFVERCIFFELNRSLTKENNDVSLDEIINRPMDLDENKLVYLSIRPELVHMIFESLKNERSKKVFSLRYGLNGEVSHTYDDIAKRVNTSRERVRQIEQSEVRKLKKEYRSYNNLFID